MEERDTRLWDAIMEWGRAQPDHEERMARAWAKTIKAMTMVLEFQWEAGILSTEEAAAECQRLLHHPKGCPDDARPTLEKLLAITLSEPPVA